MAVLGLTSQNFIGQVVQAVFQRIRKKTRCSTILDGRIIKLHYQWSFYIFLFVFSVVSFGWYFTESINCYSKFNAAVQTKADYVNICLSYPYLANEITESRLYVLFYRWIPIVVLVIACIYYLPHKISKYCENPRLKKLHEDLATSIFVYDHREKNIVDNALSYLISNFRTHNGLYFKYLFLNFLCLTIDILVFYGLDIFLNGRFRSYGMVVFPFDRDLEEFRDYMSKTFPPFVECEISSIHGLMGQRKEKLGCHLAMMEVYEKLFFFIWFWLVGLIVSTVAYIAFLIFLNLPYFQCMLLEVPKPPIAKKSLPDIIVKVLEYSKIGDIYLLYRFKQHCSANMYYDLLNRLCDSETLKVLEKHHNDRRPLLTPSNEDIRHNSGNQSSSDENISNKKYPDAKLLSNNLLLGNFVNAGSPEGTGRLMKRQQTSILVG